MTPHPDVSSGHYQEAEFAADLWQVYLGEGSAEYREPVEFFRRTFLTESLKRLLVGAVQRVAGQGGDPVVQLQTNFGGGKTHSMLALCHLFAGGRSERAGRRGRSAGRGGVKELLAGRRERDLPAGSFETFVTFAQALSGCLEIRFQGFSDHF